MLPQEVIRAKRDGNALSAPDIAAFIAGLTDGSIAESQASALAMAVFFNDMNAEERAALTRAMADSGTVLNWSHLDGPVLDKHSTGGIGDKVSLMLAPIVAACGGFVPMISGRGLGHTGGTLDKLDAIPGYRSTPDLDQFREVVASIGCAIIGQTDELAPADRRLYAIRDVTATVESSALITASILSKKLAAGLESLVMDVKIGTGAFMTTLDDARELADSLAETASRAGLPTTALITDMNQALGQTAGNALEVSDAIDLMTGRTRDPRTLDVTIALAAEMLVLGQLAPTLSDGHARASAALETGHATEVFARMVTALGGPADLVERPESYLATAPIGRAVQPDSPGFVQKIDARSLGLAVIELGGGRRRPQDSIDPAVGLASLAGIGDAVGPDRPIGVVHARDEAGFEKAAALIRTAFVIGDTPGAAGAAVIERREVPPS